MAAKVFPCPKCSQLNTDRRTTCKRCGTNLSEAITNLSEAIIDAEEESSDDGVELQLSERSDKKGRRFSVFWPKITDLESAKGAIKAGALAAGFVATVTILVAIASLLYGSEILGFSVTAALNGTIFAVAGIGIYYKKSRAASIVGLFLYIISQLTMAIASTRIGAIPIIILITLWFIASVRGTFFYHTLRKSSVHKKNVIILNLLALLYSTVILLIILICGLAFFPTNPPFITALYKSLSVITYFLTLIRKMPFTKNRVIVTYSIPESDLKISIAGKTPSDKLPLMDYSRLKKTGKVTGSIMDYSRLESKKREKIELRRKSLSELTEIKHSGLGIASFVISIVIAGAIFVLFIIAGVIETTTPGGMDEKTVKAIVIGFSIFGCILVDLIALGLGIGGLIQKNRKKIFPILGTTFSTLAIIMIVITLVV